MDKKQEILNEVLAIRLRVADLSAGLDEIRANVTAWEFDGRLARIEREVDKINHRLNLTD